MDWSQLLPQPLKTKAGKSETGQLRGRVKGLSNVTNTKAWLPLSPPHLETQNTGAQALGLMAWLRALAPVLSISMVLDKLCNNCVPQSPDL